MRRARASTHVTRPAARLNALRARPHVALTIDAEQFPPSVLSVRGTVTITEHAGVVAEYELSARRYMGDAAASAYLASLDDPSTVMARIAVVPSWVGLIDFQTRLPRALGGITQPPSPADGRST